jgi:hypothetical protein
MKMFPQSLKKTLPVREVYVFSLKTYEPLEKQQGIDVFAV